MQLQDMQNQVAVEVRNISVASDIARWLNLAITDTATSYVFNSLNRYGSVTTQANIPDIPLATDFMWLKTIGIPAEQRKLWPDDEQRLAESFPTYRTLQGVVIRYYYSGDGILGLWRVPSGGQVISYGYQANPITLVNPTDVSDLPNEWHRYICQCAISSAYSAEGNAEGYSKSKGEEKEQLRRLGASLYRRPDETFVLGGAEHRQRPPYPRLPSNFPITGR